MNSFKYWKRQELEEAFGIEQKKQLALLEQWLTTKLPSLTTQERQRLAYLKQRLADNVLDWNETELKFYFLGPLMELVNYDTDSYKSFLERPLSIQFNQETITGTVDFLIAKGKQIPRSPYFCLHEYKPETGTSNDPIGQLLIAMLAAQAENIAKNNDIPIYGAYVLGRNFHFVVLNEKTYAVSAGHNATTDDIFEIFIILRQVKTYIEQNLSI